MIDGVIELRHGSGGRAMVQLVQEVFAGEFANPFLAQGNDQAVLPPLGGRLALATDSFVVTPRFFPGGCIGDLAVNGTINDLAMGGALPRHLAASFILEEGLEVAELRRIAAAMARCAALAGVSIVTGDTKVVERGKGDGCFITTTGLGELPANRELSPEHCRPGDKIVLSGTIGDHGMAVLAARNQLGLQAEIRSDTAALHGLVEAMLEVAPSIRTMRDPTRGGLGATLNELASQSRLGMAITEGAIPVLPEVAAACEILGLDPLYIANEGKLVAVCDSEAADRLVHTMRGHPLGSKAAIIGTVVADCNAFVRMETTLGGNRMVDWLSGSQLPRIC